MAGDVSSSVITPSGIEIKFFPPPDRHYELNGKRVPGVTDILDILDKKALVWWGMEMGVAGVKELRVAGYAIDRMSTKEIVEALTRNKLTVNHVRNKAGDRGKAVHDALEVWAKTSVAPDPDMFPEEEQGYVRGLRRFLEDSDCEPVESEVMVGSLQNGFAGRFDLLLRINRSCSIVHKITPKKEYRSVVKPGTILADLKTSAHVYRFHHLQIAAYDGASIECGYSTSDNCGILRVSKDGRYEFVHSKARYEDFLSIKSAYDSLKHISAKRV